MSAVIIDGKEIALQVRGDVAAKVAELKTKGVVPCLAVILVGENPASVSYVTGKQKALAEVGMKDRSVHLPDTTTEDDLLKLIDELNNDDSVHGILVQLPLPKHINEEKVLLAIKPEKDVDGFHPVNVGNLVIGKKAFLPCTPHGIIVLLERMGIDTNGKHAVVIGRSNIVGKPVSLLLARKETNCTVTMCHTGTKNMAEITKQADILVAATGRPHTVTKDMVKEGAAGRNHVHRVLPMGKQLRERKRQGSQLPIHHHPGPRRPQPRLLLHREPSVLVNQRPPFQITTQPCHRHYL